MPRGPRIVLTGDFHIGIPVSGIKGRGIRELRRGDILGNVRKVFEGAVARGAKIVLISGDIFHTLTPKPRDFVEFDSLLSMLEERGIHVVMIAGNHDRAKVRGDRSYLEIYETRGRPYIRYFHAPPERPLVLDVEGVKVGISPLPFLSGRLVRAIVGRADKAARKYVEAVAQVVSRHLELMADADYKVLLAHLTVQGADIGPRVRYISYDDPPVPLSALRPGEFDCVALGHIHRPQRIGENVYYSGSVERVDFGEEDEEKGYWLIDLGEGSAEFIRLGCRRMVTRSVTLQPLADPVAAVEEALRGVGPLDGALVRLLVMGEAPVVRRALERIEAVEGLLLGRLGAAGYKLEVGYLPSSVEPSGEAERIDLAEALEEYIRSRYRGVKREVLEKAIKYGLEMLRGE